MKRWRVVVVLTMSLAVANGTAGGAKTDQEKLQGTWKVLRMEEKGDKASDDFLKTLTVKIAGDKLTVTEKVKGKDKEKDKEKEKDKVMIELSFKLDPAKKPKAVDFKYLAGPDKGKTELGIYEIEGDTVKFCINAPGKERPAEFASKKGTELGLLVLQRAK